jgi:carboxypeptidase-like protein
MAIRISFLIFLLTFSILSFAQEQVIIRGVISSDDTMEPLPFAHIIIGSTGTTSNLYGKFALKAKKLDTLHFSYIGFQKKNFVVPDSIKSKEIDIDIILLKDITFLRGITITSLPENLSDLKEEILGTELKDSEKLENAKKSIDIATYQYLYMKSFKLEMSAYDNHAMFLKGNEGLNPAGGNVKGFLKFLKNRAEGKPLEGTYEHYKYYQKNKGQ